MDSWWRGLHVLVALVSWTLSSPSGADAQSAPRSPDTAAARRIVDSLIRAGAWRPAVQDTARSARDTVRPGPVAAGSAAAGSAADTPRVSGSSLSERRYAIAFDVGIAVLLALGLATAFLAMWFGLSLSRRSPVSFRTHWGDFGGGNGGWEASPALALLIATLVLGILTTMVASALLSGPASSPEGAGAAAKPASAAATR